MFFSEYLCFIFGRWVESTRTDPSYPLIHFLPMPPESSSCLGMISDEGGGSAIVRLSLAARRARYVFSWYDTVEHAAELRRDDMISHKSFVISKVGKFKFEIDAIVLR